MLTILQFIVGAASLYLLFRMWRELITIASDTRKKEELSDALDKFAALYIIAKKGKEKVVTFKAKDDDDA